MSILENNFDAAIAYMKELAEKEKSNNPAEYYIGQVAYNEKSFELYSAVLIPSSTGKVTHNMMNDRYYNLLFVSKGLENVVQQFRDKYIFKVAQADISFALQQAYRGVLSSNNGEYTLKTSFYKPGIKDSTWAYKDVFHYTNLGHFLCWFNHDEEYKEVEIQAESDFIKQYDDQLRVES